jgi:tRNA-2-methylthio-N6-dimethylallyladenosine synthase
MTDRLVPKEIIDDRFSRLLAAQLRISTEINDALIGATLEVMVEGPSKRDDTVTARTRTGKVVHVAGEHLPGATFTATIRGAGPHHLIGSPV